jgi:hypothetical protein
LGARGSSPLDKPSEWGTHRGVASGRPFSPDKSGGDIQNLSTNRLKIQPNGINRVEQHLARFGDDPPNKAQIQRMRDIAAGKLKPTEADLNFYAHELRESVRYRKLGYEDRMTGSVWQPTDADRANQVWNDAHTATLEDYSIKEGPGVLYHPSVKAGGEVNTPLGGRGPRLNDQPLEPGMGIRSPENSTKELRAQPGVASGGENLPDITDTERWLPDGRVGLIPGQIARRMQGMEFKNFAEFREVFWKFVAQDRNLSNGWPADDLSRMQDGKAPKAPPSERTGRKANSVYQLDHSYDLQYGGGVYDLDSIRVVTPRFHREYGKLPD